MSHPPALMTLTTDFGTQDSYVAQMKGVILGINPAAQLIDVTHEIAPQSLLRAALLLPDLLATFPAGTFHLLVIDPGVGSNRKILAAKIDQHYLIAPDNGLLDPLLKLANQSEIRELSNPQYWRTSCSQTFHGRDIMAPALAHWSTGVLFHQLSSPLTTSPCTLDIPQPKPKAANQLTGSILYTDHFGNLLTNIRKEDLPRHNEESSYKKRGTKEESRVEIWLHEKPVCSETMANLTRHYASSPPGRPLALWSSSGFLEIAINCGNAAQTLNAGAGTRVTLKFLSSEKTD